MITIDQSKVCYIFDVDGTLTKPRQVIIENHKKILDKWIKNKQAFLATGSDYSKTLEQLGKDVISLFEATFCCMGNEVRSSNGLAIKRNHFIVPDELNDDLESMLLDSAYIPKTGRHFEIRTGMLNFSIVGRNANLKERKHYSDWDKIHNERVKIANFINKKYKNLEASVGGSISIDIIKRGCDKGQVINCLSNLNPNKIVFVGDRCSPGGNDYGIVRELEKSGIDFSWYNVSGPEETFELIKNDSTFF